MNHAFVAAFSIGIIAGLRSLTAPAAVSWAAHLNWINLQNSRLSFLGSTVSVVVLSLLAVVELVNDKLPKTPSRTSAVPFGARIVTGAFSGVALCVAANQSAVAGAILGAIGAVVGTFGGYHVRRFLTKGLHAPDFVIAVLEDIVAVCGGLFICH
jgi:uncharacterized membrane protein